jgi:hypothetical protein
MKMIKCYIWSIAFYSAENRTLRKIDQKYLESFEMWFWRVEKISWANRVRNEVSQRVKKDGNILQTIKRRKATWIGHILRRNWLLKDVIERKVKGRIEVTGRRGRRHKKLLDDPTLKKGSWIMKEDTLDRNLWRVGFGRGYGPVVIQTTKGTNEGTTERKQERMNEWMCK